MLENLPSWMKFNRLGHVEFKKNVSSDSEGVEHGRLKPALTVNDINVVSSQVMHGERVEGHKPIIDLDIEHLYVKSSTEGHAHLVLNVTLSDDQYERLLTTLADCGIIGYGIIENQWKKEKHTAMRLPGIKKEF